MRANYGGLKTRLDGNVLNWEALTDLFADAGFTDRSGQRPKPQAVRRLWQRIKKEMAEKPMAKPRPGLAPTRPPMQQPVPNPAPRDEVARVLGEMKGRKFPDIV